MMGVLGIFGREPGLLMAYQQERWDVTSNNLENTNTNWVQICFEVKITEELKWEDLSDRMQEKVDRQLNQKYRIDRRKERKEEPKETNDNEGDNSEKTETEEVTEKVKLWHKGKIYSSS